MVAKKSIPRTQNEPYETCEDEGNGDFEGAITPHFSRPRKVAPFLLLSKASNLFRGLQRVPIEGDLGNPRDILSVLLTDVQKLFL